MQFRFFSRLNLRGKITVAILLALIPFPLFTLYDYHADLARRVQLILDGHTQTAQAISVATEALLGQLRGTERVLGTRSIDGSFEELRENAEGLIRENPVFGSIHVLDKDGHLLLGIPDGRRSFEHPDIVEVLAGRRPWSTSPVFRGPSNEPRIRLNVGILRRGEIVRVVSADLRAKELGRLISPQIGEQGSYGILDSRGRALYLSFAPNLTWEKRDRSQIPSVQAALRGSPSTVNAFEDPADRVTRTGASYPVNELGWVVNVFQRTDEALQPIRSELRITLGLLLATFALALLLAGFLSTFLARPIRSLAVAVADFSRGDYSQELRIETGDEVEFLANQFNAMASVVGSKVAQQKFIAETLQRRFLPVFSLNSFSNLDVGVVYASATEEALVGGDLYDLFERVPGELGVVIGDVAGKGIGAAALGVEARLTLRALAREKRDPGKVLRALNNMLADEIPPGEFVTLFYGVLELTTGRFLYANAGHPAPRIHRPDGTIARLATTGTVIGVMKDEQFDTHTVDVLTGDYFVLYTDGVIEARNRRLLFGEKRLTRVIYGEMGRSAQEMADSIHRACLLFAGGKLADDLGLLVLRRKSTDHAARSPVSLEVQPKGLSAGQK